MEEMTIKDPQSLEVFLDWVKDIINHGIGEGNIVSIKTSLHCTTCGEWSETNRLSFSDDKMVLKSNGVQCNVKEKEHFKQKFTIEGVSNKHVSVSRKTLKDLENTYLSIQIGVGSSIEMPLTNCFPNVDFEVHKEQIYKDRGLNTSYYIQNENTLIISIQNFVDFKGLTPHFTEKLVIKYNCPIYF